MTDYRIVLILIVEETAIELLLGCELLLRKKMCVYVDKGARKVEVPDLLKSHIALARR